MVILGYCTQCGCALPETCHEECCSVCVSLSGAESLPQNEDSLSSHPRTACFEVDPFDPLQATRSRVFADYELEAEIARGGMGLVYRARQISLNRVVALKVIRAGQLALPDDVERFRIEAHAAAHLDHPRIVPIYEVGECEGIHYFSMKLVEGGNLAEHMPRYVKDHTAAARLIAAAARGIHYAHQRGVLHRDLKPANILIDVDGRPHVADFGVAKRFEVDWADSSVQKGLSRESITLSGGIVGTPSYMAPEQAAGQRNALTEASDIYSLGAILYEMLTGQPPFKAATQMATLRLVLEETPRLPQELNPRVDRALAAICLRCLERDPRARYPTAGHLVADLDRWLTCQPIDVYHKEAWKRASLWVRRSPITAALAVSLLFMTTVGTTAVSYHSRRARTALEEASTWREIATKQRLAGERSQRQFDARNYADALELAQTFGAAGQMERARQLLQVAPPEWRRWEWAYLNTNLGSKEPAGILAATPGVPLTNLSKHPHRPLLQWVENGERLVLWDLEKQATVASILGWSTRPKSSFFTGHGVDVVVLDEAGRVHCLDRLSGKGKTWGDAGAEANQATLCATGGAHTFFAYEDGRIEMRRSLDGKVLRSWVASDCPIIHIAVSSDGGSLLIANKKQVATIWDVDLGVMRCRLEDWKASAQLPAIAPRGRYVAAALPGGSVRTWDGASGQPRHFSIGHVEEVTGITFDESGDRLLTSSLDGRLIIWDAETGLKLFALPGGSARLVQIATGEWGTAVFGLDEKGMVHAWRGTNVERKAKADGSATGLQ